MALMIAASTPAGAQSLTELSLEKLMRLDAGRVGILLLIEVMAAAVSAAILTDEPFGWREAVGCVLIVTAGLIEGLDEMQARAARRRRPA